MYKQKTWVYFLFFLALSAAISCSPKYPTNHHKFLHFLYTSPTGSTLRHIITKPWLSKLTGWYTDSRISRVHIRSFIKKNSIPMHEAIRSNPSEYYSFNDFFTRTLKPSARPIDTNPRAITAPSDGAIFVAEHIEPQTTVFAKGILFNITTFLRDNKLAEHFYGGTIVIIYLAPHNYHRFHMPLDGKPSTTKTIHGAYDSVNPLVYAAGKQPLQENERTLTLLETTDNKSIAFVCVGALCVGRITHTYKPETLYKKGDELGYFSFGGSTVVLLFEKNSITLDGTILENQKKGISTPIKMGQKIGIFK